MTQPTKTYTDKNETGCCPIPNVVDWDEKEVVWENKMFIKDKTFNFMYIPLNMKGVLERMWKKIKAAKAETPTPEWMMLSHDISPWKAEHYASVMKEVPNAENVKLSGRFLTKVFEGEYKEAGNWTKEMKKYVESKGEEMKQLYFFYTTCPKCVKHYGKNYTIAFGEV